MTVDQVIQRTIGLVLVAVVFWLGMVVLIGDSPMAAGVDTIAFFAVYALGLVGIVIIILIVSMLLCGVLLAVELVLYLWAVLTGRIEWRE